MAKGSPFCPLAVHLCRQFPFPAASKSGDFCSALEENLVNRSETSTEHIIPLGTEFLAACCRQTIALYKGEVTEGAAVPCIWCRRDLVLQDGTWEERKDEDN